MASSSRKPPGFLARLLGAKSPPQVIVRKTVLRHEPHSEMWAVPDPERKARGVRWEDRADEGIAYTPTTALVAVPAALVEQARLALGQHTGVVVPLDVARTLLGADLGRRLMAVGGVDVELRIALQDALGRHLVGQPWPGITETERLKGYRTGIRLAAQAAGYEMVS